MIRGCEDISNNLEDDLDVDIHEYEEVTVKSVEDLEYEDLGYEDGSERETKFLQTVNEEGDENFSYYYISEPVPVELLINSLFKFIPSLQLPGSRRIDAGLI